MINEELINVKSTIDKKLNSVCQVLCLLCDKEFPSKSFIEYSTCSIIQTPKDTIALTVFHLISEYDPDTHIIIPFINTDKRNIADYINMNKLILDKNQSADELKIVMIEECKKDNFYIEEVSIDYEFLLRRKEYLIQHCNSDRLLDPEYLLQPLPSCDFLILNLSESLKKKIQTGDISTLIPISYEKSLIKKTGYLIGYHNVERYYICNNSADSLPERKITLNKILHPNKSVNIIANENVTDFLCTFYGATSYGFSGSPILDQDGNILGMSFSSYSATNTDQNYLELFDVISSKENFSKSKSRKNTNLYLSINHELLRGYLKFNCVDSISI